MRVTFEGESLAEVHHQIKMAAKELGENISWPVDNTPVGATKDSNTPITDRMIVQSAAEVFVQPKQHITNEVAEVTAHHEQPVNPTKIDGYSVSNGQVWVPVPGRGSAYSGVPLDKYLADKAAKESGAELDTKGVAWDPAIHTSTKARKNDGSWKLRPGGAAPKAVETPAETPQAQWQPATTEASKPATVQEVVTHEEAGPAIGRAPSMHNYDSFKSNLMTIVVRLINENKITRDYMKDLNAYFQVSNLWDVKNDNVKCKQLFDLFVQYQFIMGA